MGGGEGEGLGFEVRRGLRFYSLCVARGPSVVIVCSVIILQKWTSTSSYSQFCFSQHYFHLGPQCFVILCCCLRCCFLSHKGPRFLC